MRGPDQSLSPRPWRRLPAPLAFTLAIALPLQSGRGGASEQQPTIQFPTTTSAVVLDVVVRDGKGRPVAGLASGDFEVYEDGARQSLTGFQGIAHSPSATPPSPANALLTGHASPPGSTTSEPRTTITALVFDRMTPEARAVAYRAARRWLEGSDHARGVTGVFAIDASLRTLQPYTDDADLLGRALDRAASLSSATFTSESRTNQVAADLLAVLMPREPAAVDSADQPVTVRSDDVMGELTPLPGLDRGTREKILAMARQLRRMETFYETISREQQGYTTMNSLLALIASLQGLDGRKSVVLFSEGLALPPGVQAQFESLVDASMRANVAVYSVHTAGLSVDSPLARSRSDIQSYTARRERAHQDQSGIALTELEANEDALRRDPQAALGTLADESGGFLVRDTNDLGPWLRRIDEDARMHYVLAYTPTNQEYDGRFRRVEVKVNRRRLHVQARRGYYALRAEGGPVLPHEARALAALERMPRPRAFPVRVTGLSFPDGTAGSHVPVVVSLPARSLTFETKGGSYRAEFDIVARVRAADGTLVRKVGQPYRLRGSISELEAARAADVLFYRETRLPPGRFTLEAVAYDRLSDQAGVGLSELVVQPQEPGHTQVSSLVLVKNAQRVPAGQRAVGALSVGDVVLQPVVDEPVSRSWPLLTFFFSACASAGSPPPAARVELLRAGQPVHASTVALPALDSTGCVRHLAGIPFEGLSDGTHELRLVLGEAEHAVVRVTRFELSP